MGASRNGSRGVQAKTADITLKHVTKDLVNSGTKAVKLQQSARMEQLNSYDGPAPTTRSGRGEKVSLSGGGYTNSGVYAGAKVAQPISLPLQTSGEPQGQSSGQGTGQGQGTGSGLNPNNTGRAAMQGPSGTRAPAMTMQGLYADVATAANKIASIQAHNVARQIEYAAVGEGARTNEYRSAKETVRMGYMLIASHGLDVQAKESIATLSSGTKDSFQNLHNLLRENKITGSETLKLRNASDYRNLMQQADILSQKLGMGNISGLDAKALEKKLVSDNFAKLDVTRQETFRSLVGSVQNVGIKAGGADIQKLTKAATSRGLGVGGKLNLAMNSMMRISGDQTLVTMRNWYSTVQMAKPLAEAILMEEKGVYNLVKMPVKGAGNAVSYSLKRSGHDHAAQVVKNATDGLFKTVENGAGGVINTAQNVTGSVKNGIQTANLRVRNAVRETAAKPGRVVKGGYRTMTKKISSSRFGRGVDKVASRKISLRFGNKVFSTNLKGVTKGTMGGAKKVLGLPMKGFNSVSKLFAKLTDATKVLKKLAVKFFIKIIIPAVGALFSVFAVIGGVCLVAIYIMSLFSAFIGGNGKNVTEDQQSFAEEVIDELDAANQGFIQNLTQLKFDRQMVGTSEGTYNTDLRNYTEYEVHFYDLAGNLIVDEDGNPVKEYDINNSRAILSLASVFMPDGLEGEGGAEAREAYKNYCLSLWAATHSFTVGDGEVYYVEDTDTDNHHVFGMSRPSDDVYNQFHNRCKNGSVQPVPKEYQYPLWDCPDNHTDSEGNPTDCPRDGHCTQTYWWVCGGHIDTDIKVVIGDLSYDPKLYEDLKKAEEKRKQEKESESAKSESGSESESGSAESGEGTEVASSLYDVIDALDAETVAVALTDTPKENGVLNAIPDEKFEPTIVKNDVPLVTARSKVTATFYDDSGEVYRSRKATDGVVTVPDFPKGEDYYCWRCEDESIGDVFPGDEIEIRRDVSFELIATEDLLVTFYDADYNVYDQREIKTGEPLLMPEFPEDSGDEIKGWVSEGSEEGSGKIWQPGDVMSHVFEDMDFQLVGAEEKVVYFYDFDGNEIDDYTIRTNAYSRITLPGNPEPVFGYGFRGWIDDINEQTYRPYTEYTVTDDVSFQANYVEGAKDIEDEKPRDTQGQQTGGGVQVGQSSGSYQGGGSFQSGHVDESTNRYTYDDTLASRNGGTIDKEKEINQLYPDGYKGEEEEVKWDDSIFEMDVFGNSFVGKKGEDNKNVYDETLVNTRMAIFKKSWWPETAKWVGESKISKLETYLTGLLKDTGELLTWHGWMDSYFDDANDESVETKNIDGMSNREIARVRYSMDWYELYGIEFKPCMASAVTIAGLGGSGLSDEEIAQLLANNVEWKDLCDDRKAIMALTIQFYNQIKRLNVHYHGAGCSAPSIDDLKNATNDHYFGKGQPDICPMEGYPCSTQRGIDCSGFVSWILHQMYPNLFSIRMSTRDLGGKIGSALLPINGELQPGDIALSPGHHVMMYIGNGQWAESQCHSGGIVYGSTRNKWSGYGFYRVSAIDESKHTLTLTEDGELEEGENDDEETGSGEELDD